MANGIGFGIVEASSGVYFGGFDADDNPVWTTTEADAWATGYKKMAQAQASLLIALGYGAQRKTVMFTHKDAGKW